MKEIIINVPEDAVQFVEEFVARIGGNVVEESPRKRRKNTSTKEEPFRLSDIFGSWPDIPLDPVTHRKQLWRRKVD